MEEPKAPKTINQKLNIAAVTAAGITSFFMLAMIVWYTILLSDGARWCDITTSGCLTIVQKLIDALAFNSHMALGVIALCVAVLITLVIAKGTVSFKGGAGGVEANISNQETSSERPVTDVTVNVGPNQ